MAQRIPVIVLGGSDMQPGPVPSGMSPDNMLTGYKGTLRLASGRCLAGELIERLRRSGRFEDPVLVGPRDIYQPLVDCEVVDVIGNLSTTLQRVREFIRNRYSLSAPLAVSTCDILPTGEEIGELLETCYDPVSGSVFWGELVAAQPEQMGASAWKPGYLLPPDDGLPLENFYPGHLVIIRPAALRIRLTNYLLQLAYRYRNRDLRHRRWRMFVRGLGRLALQDCRNLLSLQLPILSIAIPYYCFRAYRRFRKGELSVPDFARHVAKVFVHRSFHRQINPPPVVFSQTSILSLAKDIDTKSELAELSQQVCGTIPK